MYTLHLFDVAEYYFVIFQKLPSFTPVQTKVPEKYFGDVLMVMEFIFSFSKLLRAKDFFPHGLTFKLMERALIEKEVNFKLFILSLHQYMFLSF